MTNDKKLKIKSTTKQVQEQERQRADRLAEYLRSLVINPDSLS